jgi:hypothetical protein
LEPNSAKKILYPFLDATLLVQKQEMTIAKVIPLLEFLISTYKDGICKHACLGDDNEVHLIYAANLGLAKLDKYYSIVRDISVYTVALILDLASKFDFLKFASWTEEDMNTSRTHLKMLWSTYYKDCSQTNNPSSSSQPLHTTAFGNWRAGKQKLINSNQLDMYLSQPAEPWLVPSSEITWWLEK